ncbi:MAG: methylated-DNA--[protein]-cysteine S-methyltransferase [Gemmatimonadaceae bacterium]
MHVLFTVFDTPIGPCGLAWTDGGVIGVQLPEHDATGTRAKLLRRFRGARESTPPAHVRDAIDGIQRQLQGTPTDLTAIDLDMGNVPSFDRLVYATARAIPPGSTLTYGEIATRIGHPDAARDVGQALARNPLAIVVPCHRVLASGGKLGGFSAAGGTATKRRLLEIEGALAPERTLFDTL